MSDEQTAELERWEVTVTCIQPGVRGDKDELRKLLTQGWEPFAVTWDGDAWDYHLRRLVAQKQTVVRQGLFACPNCGEEGLWSLAEGTVCRLCGEEARESFKEGWDESD